MKYIEYIYLAASVALLVMLVDGFEEFGNTQKIAVLVAVTMTSFMFSFRRKQRLELEKKEKKRIEEMEKDMEDEPDV